MVGVMVMVGRRARHGFEIENLSMCFTNVLTLFVVDLGDAFHNNERDASLERKGREVWRAHLSPGH